METAALWVFWLSAASLAYIYAGFPLLVAAVGRWRRRHVHKAPVTPSLSLIIAAYNEEAVIGERLENALAADYPPTRLQIIVASDGSTDRTEAIVSRYAEREVLLLALPRQGKIHALDEAVRRATGDIIVFSDANTMCHAQALRALASNFADPEVGGVAGRTGYCLSAGSESSAQGESLYWDYDTRLKQLESLTGSVVSAHGGLYAVRRTLYRRGPDPAVTDDFAISTGVVDQGFRLVFEPNARASEGAVAETRHEFRRRVRLMTRGLRGVIMRRRLLNPFRSGFYAVVLFSHKVARRAAPLALLTLAASSVVLASRGPFHVAAALAQGLFYALGALGYLLRRARVGGTTLLYVPFFYCMANAASAVALVQVIRGCRIERWQPQRHGAAS